MKIESFNLTPWRKEIKYETVKKCKLLLKKCDEKIVTQTDDSNCNEHMRKKENPRR